MKKFVNYTKEDFSHKWDGKVFKFKAGREIYLEDYLAEHFAKHLAEREMLKDGHEDFLEHTKKEYLAKILITEEEEEIEVEDIPDAKTRALNKNTKAKKEEKTAEDEFEGLKETKEEVKEVAKEPKK